MAGDDHIAKLGICDARWGCVGPNSEPSPLQLWYQWRRCVVGARSRWAPTITRCDPAGATGLRTFLPVLRPPVPLKRSDPPADCELTGRPAVSSPLTPQTGGQAGAIVDGPIPRVNGPLSPNGGAPATHTLVPASRIPRPGRNRAKRWWRARPITDSCAHRPLSRINMATSTQSPHSKICITKASHGHAMSPRPKENRLILARTRPSDRQGAGGLLAVGRSPDTASPSAMEEAPDR